MYVQDQQQTEKRETRQDISGGKQELYWTLSIISAFMVGVWVVRRLGTQPVYSPPQAIPFPSLVVNVMANSNFIFGG